MTAEAEDWHGRYWRRERWARARQCADPLCLWSVVLENRPDGWWWTHDHMDHEPAEAGPFEHWQEAAEASVQAGHARPFW